MIQFQENRALDVIPIGRICLDINPLDYYMTLSQSTKFTKYIGGSPANTAVGLARLGVKTGFLGRVSDDRMGDFALEFFTNEGIDTSHIFRAQNGEKMGLAFTEILSRDESSILMYRDNVADLTLCSTDVDEAYIADAKSIIISGSALSKSPSREACLKALQLAKKNGTVVVFDIDYRPYTWINEEETSIYYSIAAHEADVIMGSREEYDLTELICCPGNDDAKSAQYWIEQGASLLVIKHGKKGSSVFCADGSKHDITPIPVEALKSFGGGDGYASAFLYALLQNMPVSEALRLGNAEASMLVAAHGCSAFMPSVEELRQFLAENEVG